MVGIGGTGSIGSHLMEALTEGGQQVLTLDGICAENIHHIEALPMNRNLESIHGASLT